MKFSQVQEKQTLVAGVSASFNYVIPLDLSFLGTLWPFRDGGLVAFFYRFDFGNSDNPSIELGSKPKCLTTCHRNFWRVQQRSVATYGRKD